MVRRMLAHMNEDPCTNTNRASAKAVRMEVAAELVGVGRTTMYGLVMSGQMRSLKVGSRCLVPISAIDEFVERNSQGEDD
jgi:excisionase family DNA binding protein